MMNATPVNSEVSNLNRKNLMPWLVCFSAALFFFYEFIQMNMFNPISANLMSDFHLDATGLGYLSATYFAGDVLFLFPAGILLDRLSVRKVIICAMLLCITGTFVFATTTSVVYAAIAHFAAGIGNAFSFLSCVLLASRWFPPKRMALVTGLIVTFAMLGGSFAQTPMTFLVESVGWRHALIFIAMLGIVILAIIAAIVRDYPSDQESLQQQRQKDLKSIGFFKSIMLALKNRQNWAGGIYTCLLNLPIMVLGGLWGSLHLMQEHHLNAEQASNVSMMIFFGTIIGAPLLGFISDRMGLRKMPMIISAIISIAVILAIMYWPNPNYMQLILLYLMLGVVTSAQVLSYPAIAEDNPKILTGTAMGIASVLIMGGGFVSQPLFGILLGLNWNHVSNNGTPVFSTQDFNTALMMIPIAFVIGLIATIFIKETYCQPIDNS